MTNADHIRVDVSLILNGAAEAAASRYHIFDFRLLWGTIGVSLKVIISQNPA